MLLAILNGLGNLLHARLLNRSSIFVVFAAYLFMAWALAHHRIFNARHVFALVGQRALVVATLAAASWGISIPLRELMTDPGAWIVSICLCGSSVFWLDQRSREWLGLGDERLLAQLRTEVVSVSQQEAGSNRLVSGFEHLLATHHQAGFAAILFKQGEVYEGRGIQFAIERPGFLTLCECGWITPESLQRRRTTPGLADLSRFLEDNGLGIIVTVPRESPTPSLLVTVGIKSNEWPFTYPETRRLQNVAELMDNILTQSRLTDQMAMRARIEHLAMMSRGLAHDLKNLITPVSAFLDHNEGKATPGSAEAEVHAAARRSVRIMTDYVREALFFSDRLSPRFEPVDLARMLDGVRAVTSARALARGVTLALDHHDAAALTADAVLLQRMLANLVNNAIDASARGQTVTLAVSASPSNRVQFSVIDQGGGMTPEVIDRIFDPYFTTKQYGEDLRGFGLGLTISQKIVDLHEGTIVVSSKPGKGTRITVDIPTRERTEATGITENL